MLRRNLPMFLAVGGSLVVHGLFIGGTTRVRLAPALPGAEREQRVTVVVLGPSKLPDNEALPQPQDPPPAALDKDPAQERDSDPPKPEPNKAKNEPLPKPKPPEVERFPDLIGDMAGKGIGTHDAEGELPLKAREADADQPFLSRDPRGPGRVGNDPTPSLIPPGEGGSGGAPARPAVPEIAAGAPPLPIPERITQQVSQNASAVETSRPPVVAPSKSDQTTPAPAPFILRLPAPTSIAENDPGVHLGPLLLLPKPAAKRAIAGAEKKPGTGDAGAANELTLTKDISGALPPRVERPSATAGKTEGVVSPTPIPVPRVAPPRTSDEPDPAAAKPKIALLLIPPLQPSYVPLPPGPDPSAAAPPTPAAPKPQESPVVAAPPAPPTPPAPAGRPAPTPNPPTAIGDGRRPGPATPAADPAQASDSESDPFARIGSANLLRDGKLEVQFGRKVKTVRPKVPLVGQIDAFAMVNPSVTLKVNIDLTGKVTHAMIHKSSGSNEIDQPCLIAMYEWWFEPLKDKSGKPIPDSLLFTISFR